MRKDILVSLFIVLLLLSLTPNAVRASYDISMSGEVNFTGEPWEQENFTGSVVVNFGPDAPSQIDITLSVSGEISPWFTWTGASEFTLYPSQKKALEFQIEFPATAPAEYNGLITATGTPSPDEILGGAIAPSNIAVSIGVSVNVPARVYFQNIYADDIGAASIVANYKGTQFTGNVTYNLSESGSWLETHVRNITSLPDGQTNQTSVYWSTIPRLGVIYDVKFTLREFDGTLIDEKFVQFRLPTPADIESIAHRPSVIYADYNATIVAKVHEAQNGQTECTAHYIIDGGAEQTVLMSYDSTNDEYLLLIINTSYHEGSFVEYWVSSYNDASGVVYNDTSIHKNFWVFPSTAPDLVISENSFYFSPTNPITQAMYETNSTSIFVTVRNAGRGDAVDVVVEMQNYNSTVTTRTIVSIASGDSGTVTFPFLNPLPGPHLLGFIVDPANNIIESNEENNYYTLAEFTVIEVETPQQPPGEAIGDLIPFILIPVVILIIIFLFLFMRKGKTVKVKVHKVKEFTSARDGVTKWKYICSYEDKQIGITRITDIRAAQDEIIEVKPEKIIERKDGNLGWDEADVVKVHPKGEADSEPTIRKLLGKEKD